MAIEIEFLDEANTPLGELCLRRRRTLAEPRQWVTEVTLNDEFLMSSLHTDSEQALAQVPLEQLSGSDLRVLIGGLGLGYTAQAALACQQVASVEVVEYLLEVIRWLRDDLIPLASELNASQRLVVTQGDIYARLLSAPDNTRFDAILIDVDHSPEDQLSGADAGFYQPAGLRAARQHLAPGGVLALWSYDEHTSLQEQMQSVFAEAAAHPIRYFNQHVHEHFTDWLYIARRD